MDKEQIRKQAWDAVLTGDPQQAIDAAQQWIGQQMPALELIDRALMPAIREVGNRWESGDFFLPELVAGAETMKAALDVLQPHLETSPEVSSTRSVVVIGTIQGDIHDIGKSIVAAMLRADGFSVIDLGVDVSPGKFLDTAKETRAALVCISSLLTTTMPGIRDVVALFQQEGLIPEVRFMAGGAPVTQEWALQAGVDGYAGNAVEAVRVARRLTESLR